MRGTQRRKNKVAIIGAGSVGATIAYNLSLKGSAIELVLVDIDVDKANAERLDILHGIPLGKTVHVTCGDYEACSDAEVAIITAGAKQRAGESRVDLLNRNASIARSMASSLKDAGFDGILLVVTNPVDVLTYIIQRESGLPATRVIGSGTILDTARLREYLAGYCSVSPLNIHGYVLGEHGQTSFPAWSLTTVGGLAVDAFARQIDKDPVADGLYRNARDYVRGAAGAIIAAKGSTYYAVAQAVSVMVEAVLRDEKRILPISTVVEKFRDFREVTFSYPAILGAEGLVHRIEVRLSEDEERDLEASIGYISENIRKAEDM